MRTKKGGRDGKKKSNSTWGLYDIREAGFLDADWRGDQRVMEYLWRKLLAYKMQLMPSSD